jgi:hypothetical protein
MNLPPCHRPSAGHRPWATLCLLALLPVLSLAGCSNLGVQPWERDLLAKPAMQLTPSAVEAGVDDHIYFSKEAATGGRGTGGGGCGCN